MGRLPDGSWKYISSWFCGLRLCPMCSWKRSERLLSRVAAITNTSAFRGLQFVFLTMTFRNVPALPRALDKLWGGWRKLTASKDCRFSKAFSGTLRAIEITCNKTRKDYHAHLHVMAAVPPGYFKKTNKNYISHERLMNLWRKVGGLDYDPWVDIRRCRGGTVKPIAEIAKYTVKSADIPNAEVL